jgi:flavin reductase (DIM6/NTAB) family NADH-FMN oxidoreductase RutF
MPDSQPDPAFFRKTMGLFTTGIAVLATTTRDGEVVGMTANSIVSVSLDPMLLLIGVEKIAHIAPTLQEADGFSFNFLGAQQANLSDYFAGRLLPEGPPDFEYTAWTGGPLLTGCIAAIGCRRHSILEGGDHWIVIGEVQALFRPENPEPPLIFFGSRYHTLSADMP